MESFFHNELTLIHRGNAVIRKVRVPRRAEDLEVPLDDWTPEWERAGVLGLAELEVQLEQTQRADIDKLQHWTDWFEWRAKRREKQGAKRNVRLHSLVSELDTIYRYFRERDLKRTREETKRPRKCPDDSVEFVVTVCRIVDPNLKRKTIVNSMKQIIAARKRDKKKHVIAARIIYDRGKITRHDLP